MAFAFPIINENKNDFHEFRAKGIGSSDLPIILGKSPYKTKRRLWQERVGIVENNFIGNYATQRGTDLEPEVRKWYNNKFNLRMIPERKVSDSFEYLRCNADGVDHAAKKMIEIKCGGFDDHESGSIPEKYIPQCVYLSLIFGYPLDYVSYNERSKEKYKVIALEYTDEYALMIIDEAHKFWKMIQDKTEPEITDRDDLQIDDSETIELVQSYAEMKEEYTAIEKKLKSLQNILSSRVTHNRSVCNGHRMSWITRKTGVKYFTIKKLAKEIQEEDEYEAI